MPGPNLQSIESDAPSDSDDDNLFGGIHNVIYQATSEAYQEYRKVRSIRHYGIHIQKGQIY